MIEQITYDFDPRELVQPCTPNDGKCSEEACLSAIYIPTKGRPKHLNELLASIASLDTPIHLLISEPSDINAELLNFNIQVHVRENFGAEFDRLLSSMRTRSHPKFSIPDDQWDLPIKRNFALWHATSKNYSRILLLDDDIRGLTSDKIHSVGRALQSKAIAGFFVTDFPDTSVMGHVEIELGHAVPTFLSGSCIGIKVSHSVGTFPPVYNEDWLYMAPHISEGGVCTLGNITQVEYDTRITPNKAVFQEPGEVLGDGTYALLASQRFDQRFDRQTWERLLELRFEWLSNLKKETENSKHTAAIDAALECLSKITADDCVTFWSDWEEDCRVWNLELQKVRSRDLQNTNEDDKSRMA